MRRFQWPNAFWWGKEFGEHTKLKAGAPKGAFHHSPHQNTKKARPWERASFSCTQLPLVCAFNEQHPRMTLSQVAERTGLTRANARRILLTLETMGYVTQHERLFSLRPRVLEIGYAFLSSLDLPFYAQPVIDDLVERTHTPCNLAMLDGDEIIYVLRASTPHSPTPPIPLNVGRSFPAYVTSMGRVLLGALPATELDAYFERADIQPFTPKTVIDKVQLKTLIKGDAARGW